MEISTKLIIKTSINDENLRTKICTNLNEFRKNGKFTDVTLKTRDETEIQVHRNIMSRESSYFDSLFENKNYSSSQIINISYEISGYHMELIIDFIYTGTIHIKFEDALTLNEYANVFFIKTLEEETTKFLCNNINSITCLKYWRHSEKMSNFNLKQNCFQYILENTEIFLDNAITELNFKEIKLILSNLKISCPQEIILKNVIIWIKIDLIDRQSYIKELLENINMTEISTRFIENNILPDEDLMKSPDLQIVIFKIFQKNLQIQSDLLPVNYNSQISIPELDTITEKTSTTSIKYQNEFNKNLPSTEYISKDESERSHNQILNKNLITFSTIWMSQLNFDSESAEKLFKHKQRTKYSVNSMKSNCVFLSGGGWFKGTKKCQIYCNKTKTIKLLSPMKSNRKFHRTIELNDKVFACGGLFNRKSMEYFDIGSEIWQHCNSNLLEKEKDFGIISYENSIYTFGGTTSLLNSKSIERFDQRENKWYNLNMNSSIDLLVTRSVRLNDTVYCFGTHFGLIYDIRKNRWREQINYPGSYESWYNFDVTEINNKIIIGKSTLLAQKYNLLEYDVQQNNWTDKKINMEIFKGFMDFNIVKIYD